MVKSILDSLNIENIEEVQEKLEDLMDKKYKENVIYPLIKSFNQDFIYSQNLRYKFNNI